MQVNMHEAKSRLSALGEKVVIAKAGKPYLDIIPHKEERPPRKPGRYKGEIHIADDFDKTPEEVIRDFEGED